VRVCICWSHMSVCALQALSKLLGCFISVAFPAVRAHLPGVAYGAHLLQLGTMYLHVCSSSAGCDLSLP